MENYTLWVVNININFASIKPSTKFKTFEYVNIRIYVYINICITHFGVKWDPQDARGISFRAKEILCIGPLWRSGDPSSAQGNPSGATTMKPQWHKIQRETNLWNIWILTLNVNCCHCWSINCCLPHVSLTYFLHSGTIGSLHYVSGNRQ